MIQSKISLSTNKENEGERKSHVVAITGSRSGMVVVHIACEYTSLW